MKTKNLFLGVLAVALLASCSDDKVTGISPSANGEEITYSVVTNKATRATSLYSNSTKPESFYVWAIADNDDSYIPGDEIISEDGGSTYTDITNTRYWPSGHTLDFYAFNGGGEFDSDTKTIAYTVESDVAEQEDLLYAVTLGQSNEDGTVNLNFRHALSQITFKVENNSNDYTVIVAGISVHNVYGSGSFTLPTESTGDNYTEGDATEPTPVQWTPDENSEATSSYALDWDEQYYSLGVNNDPDEPATSTDDYFNVGSGLYSVSNAMMLIPQESDNVVEDEVSFTDGPYFTIKCAIYQNVPDREVHFGSSNQYSALMPEPSDFLLGCLDADGFTFTFANANIPVSINWEAGKCYTYTFSFGSDYNGGVDDDNNPILAKISYSVEVNDFVPVDDDEDETVEMDSYGVTSINGYTFIDLGLPSGVKWATCNVGADSPTDYGNYYAWGEIEPAAELNYSSDNCTLYSAELVNSISGDADYDAATAYWGAPCRMPTYDEFTELKNNCTYETITVNGVSGRKVTGPNGNSIFIPAAGYYKGTTLSGDGSYDYMWTSTSYYNVKSDGSITYYTQSYRGSFKSKAGSISSSSVDRAYGFPVRPVAD